MMIMEPDGSIQSCMSGAPAAGGADVALERVLMLSDELGHDIATEVRAMVDAKLASLAVRLGPGTSGASWRMATV